MGRFKVAHAAAVLGVLLAALSAVSVFSCASQGRNGSLGAGSSGGGSGSGGGGADGSIVGGDDGGPVFGGEGGPPTSGNCTGLQHACTTACMDFPTAPFIDSTPDDGSPATPANAATHFSGTAATSGGPCILDPVDGVIIPYNWVRPRFRIAPAAGQDLFEISLTTPREANPYVAYTMSTQFGLPKKVWTNLVKTAWGDPITVTITGVNSSNNQALASSTSTFTIAPASAGGNMIYWAAVGDCVIANCKSAPPPAKTGWSWLEGFGPGDEGVATTLTVYDVQETVASGNGTP